MTRKVYRTAMGKMVDLGALQLQNENIRAVGNMGVNARGDLLDSQNRVIDTRNKQVSRQYNRQTNVSDDKVYTSAKSTRKAPEQTPIPKPPEDFDDDFVKSEEATPPESPSTGLAAAIARARQIKQEPLKTSRQIAQEKSGPTKI